MTAACVMMPAPKPTDSTAAAAPAMAARLPHEVFFGAGSNVATLAATASSPAWSSTEAPATDSRGVPANALLVSSWVTGGIRAVSACATCVGRTSVCSVACASDWGRIEVRSVSPAGFLLSSAMGTLLSADLFIIASQIRDDT